MRRSDVPELLRPARTLDAWSDDLLAYWTTTGRRGVSNGPTDAIKARVKKVKRVGHGFQNFDDYRLLLPGESGLASRALAGFAPPGHGPLTTLWMIWRTL